MLKTNAFLALALTMGLSIAAFAADAHIPGPYGAAPRATKEGLLYVNKLTVDQPEGKRELAIKVEGDLPDAAWKFLRLDVHHQGRTITVKALGSRDKAAIAIQVLRPFTGSTTVTGLKPGRYQVVVQGRSKNITRDVQVK